MELSERAGRKISEHSGNERISPSGSECIESRDTSPDLPPEYCHYRDEGCELAESCLDCPFPECIYDRRGGRQQWFKGLRDREMVRLFAEGKEVKELASRFGVSRRTVQRALRRNKNE